MLRFILENGSNIETPGRDLSHGALRAIAQEYCFSLEDVVQIWYPDKEYGGEAHLSGGALIYWLDGIDEE